MLQIRHVGLGPTLRRPYHSLTNEDGLPNPALHGTICRGRVAMPTRSVVFVVVIQAQLFSHLHTLNNAHPGTVEVAASRRSLPCLQDQEKRLKCAESGDVQERFSMPCSVLVKSCIPTQSIFDLLVAKASHCCPSVGSSTILPASANIASRTKGETDSLSVCHCR